LKIEEKNVVGLDRPSNKAQPTISFPYPHVNEHQQPQISSPCSIFYRGRISSPDSLLSHDRICSSHDRRAGRSSEAAAGRRRAGETWRRALGGGVAAAGPRRAGKGRGGCWRRRGARRRRGTRPGGGRTRAGEKSPPNPTLFHLSRPDFPRFCSPPRAAPAPAISASAIT
jgi:hypothetical protein